MQNIATHSVHCETAASPSRSGQLAIVPLASTFWSLTMTICLHLSPQTLRFASIWRRYTLIACWVQLPLYCWNRRPDLYLCSSTSLGQMSSDAALVRLGAESTAHSDSGT